MLLDADLLTAVAEGDADAFSRFYDRHSAALFGLCLRILRNAKADLHGFDPDAAPEAREASVRAIAADIAPGVSDGIRK